MVDEHSALAAECVYDMLVVDDLVPNINGCAVLLDCALYDLDCPDDAGAKSAGLGEDDLHNNPFIQAGEDVELAYAPEYDISFLAVLRH